MFGDNKDKFFKENKDTERSLISESVIVDGTIRSSGSMDIAGKVNGPIISKEVVIKETGAVLGEIEADIVEVNGRLEGKISAQNIVIGTTGIVKGDVEFSQNLRTEDGADIEGYIKKTASAGKNKNDTALTGDFLFAKSKKEDKKHKNGKPNA